MSARLCYARPVLTILLLACTNDSNIKRVPEAPTVYFVTPAADAVLRIGEEPFLAVVSFADSYSLATAMTVSWDLDGIVAAGDIVASSERSGESTWEMPLGEGDLGPHHITALVTDEDGDAASASLDFELLGPVEPPVVTITRPDDGTSIALGEELTFQGEATDTTTPAADLVLTWTLNGDPMDGAITSDGSSIVIATLPGGVHEVVLTAIDGDGDVGSDRITVTVLDEPVEAEPGDLVFSELMVDPELVEDEVGEWVELYNTSGSTIDIGGYTFRDDDVDTYTLLGPATVGPGDYVVLCANMDITTNGGVACDVNFFRDSTGNGLALANGPDEVVLARPDGVEIDWLYYDDTWYEPGIAIGVDPSFQDAGNNDDLSHWCDQRTVLSAGAEPGTPGADNDPCE